MRPFVTPLSGPGARSFRQEFSRCFRRIAVVVLFRVRTRVELVRRYAKRSAGPYTDSDVAVERGEALVLILSRVLLSCSS